MASGGGETRISAEAEQAVEQLAVEFNEAHIGISKMSTATAQKERKRMKRVASRVILNQDKHGKRSIFAKIYLSEQFENIALMVIVANAVWIGVDIDWNNGDDSGLPPIFFEVGELSFCTMFTVELLIRILAYRRKEQFFYDPDMRRWNVFDLFLVFFMLLDGVVLTYIVKVDSSQLQLLSTMRLIRLMRMTRMLRMVPELGMMVKSMMAAVRSVASTALLAVGIMYLFAILLTQWVKSYGSEGKCLGEFPQICLKEYFGSILLSFLALTQILVFDDTFEIVRPIFKEKFLIGFLLILYILLVSFTVLNMLIGIICDIVAETTECEREKQLMRRVEEIFNEMDIDGSGTVTKSEFEEGDTHLQLERLGIEPQVLKNAFDIMDVDRSGQLMSTDFIRLIFKCLHDPHSEEIMEIEARVDKLADVIGLGRSAICVLEKERITATRRQSTKSFVDGGEPTVLAEITGMSPWIASVEAAAEKARQKALAARAAMVEKAAEEAEYAQRLRSLGRRLGDVLLLAEAGSLSNKQNLQPQANGASGGSESMLMLENGPNDGWAAADARAAMPMPSAGLMTILRPAMRALDARLHALRAECKAAGMRHAGNLAGSQGQDLLPRHSLQPLDELITEVIARLQQVSKTMCSTEPQPMVPSAAGAIRQREVLALEDARASSEVAAQNPIRQSNSMRAQRIQGRDTSRDPGAQLPLDPGMASSPPLPPPSMPRSDSARAAQIAALRAMEAAARPPLDNSRNGEVGYAPSNASSASSI